jgi:hypothetical protein
MPFDDRESNPGRLPEGRVSITPSSRIGIAKLGGSGQSCRSNQKRFCNAARILDGFFGRILLPPTKATFGTLIGWAKTCHPFIPRFRSPSPYWRAAERSWLPLTQWKDLRLAKPSSASGGEGVS